MRDCLNVVCDFAARESARILVTAPVVRRGYDIYGNMLLKLAQLFAELLVAYALAVVGQISGYHPCGGRVFKYLLKSRVDYLARLLEALLIRFAAVGICLAAV